VENCRHLSGPIDRAAKRALDLLLSVSTLVLMAPVGLIIAGSIRLESRGPVFFRARRLGKRGRIIIITKFRTMHEGAAELFNPDGSRHVGLADPRITRVGRVLRGGLDEIPQLEGVVRGHLTLVGPRPDDLYALHLYEGAQWLKLAVTPGITGLAQVSGRTDLPWSSRLKLDAYYVRHRSILLDMRIMLRTIGMALGLVFSKPLVNPEDVERHFGSDEAETEAEALEVEIRKRLDFASVPSPPGQSGSGGSAPTG
jgi:lipopolysaccharide/colanic/teichoic acid biosynthesis glycosyltransferase